MTLPVRSNEAYTLSCGRSQSHLLISLMHAVLQIDAAVVQDQVSTLSVAIPQFSTLSHLKRVDNVLVMLRERVLSRHQNDGCKAIALRIDSEVMQDPEH